MILALLIFTTTLLSSITFAYLWIDRSISLSYMEASFIISNNENQNLLIILNDELKDKSSQEIIKKLEAIITKHPNKNLFLKNKDNSVWFGDIKFEFKEGKLKEISG